MAYVQPNSIVQLFRGINLDNRYLHTIYFASESAQNTWFTSKVYKTYQQISYTRYTRNSIKLKADTTEIMDCTYLRFKNDRSVDKWFYAFINSVEYVNENTCLITYEIDVMQTWFIQAGTLQPSYILRQHVSSDTFGTNLEAEPVGSDVYDCDEITYTSTDGALFGTYSLVVNTTEDPNDAPASTIFNNKLYNGTKFRVISADDATALSNFTTALQLLLQGSWQGSIRPVEIVDMFTFPTKFCDTDVLNNTHPVKVTHPTTLDGYTPKNKKLYGYPFSYLQASTKDGSGSLYKWEYFDGMLATSNDANFTAYGNPIGGGNIICYPDRYNGINNNIDCKIAINNFPKNPFNYDAYQAWIASGGSTRLEMEETITNVRGVTALVKSASNAILGSGASGLSSAGTNAARLSMGMDNPSSGVAGYTGGLNQMIQGAGSHVETAMNVLEAQNKIGYQWADAHYQPNQIMGSATPNVMVSLRALDFYFFSVHVRKDELVRLDDFLSCFGYAINKVETPNLHSRQYWNFIQTQGAVVTGNMPASSKDAIARIFDGGITFWHNGDQIGNYRQSVSSGSINNPIL